MRKFFAGRIFGTLCLIDAEFEQKITAPYMVKIKIIHEVIWSAEDIQVDLVTETSMTHTDFTAGAHDVFQAAKAHLFNELDKNRLDLLKALQFVGRLMNSLVQVDSVGRDNRFPTPEI
jgi:hypothetical protein